MTLAQALNAGYKSTYDPKANTYTPGCKVSMWKIKPGLLPGPNIDKITVPLSNPAEIAVFKKAFDVAG